jgi:hypothetical protein
VPCNHLVVAIDQHRDIRVESPDAVGDLLSASCYGAAGSRGQALVLQLVNRRF